MNINSILQSANESFFHLFFDTEKEVKELNLHTIAKQKGIELISIDFA